MRFFLEKTPVFIDILQSSIRLKKFKHTNEELELAKLQTEREKKNKSELN